MPHMKSKSSEAMPHRQARASRLPAFKDPTTDIARAMLPNTDRHPALIRQ
jgi:hypothetical protein